MDYRDSMVPFLVLATALIVGEIVWRRRAGAGYDFSAFGASMFIYIGQIIINPLLNYAVMGAAMYAVHAFAPFQFDLGDWRHWVIAFFVVELAYYWQHRLSHTVRWMWATHSVHHSPNELALPSAFRLGWTGLFSGSWLIYLIPSFLGIPPLVILGLLALNLRFQFLLHTDLVGRLGPLEWIFNTPSNHRVHHSSRPEHLDKNFGGMLMIFDHVFGSYAAEDPKVAVEYGLTDPIHSRNPFVILFREWGRMLGDVRREVTLSGKLRAAFGPPGAKSEPAAAPKLLPAE